jgi:uncharacterized membrane protein
VSHSVAKNSTSAGSFHYRTTLALLASLLAIGLAIAAHGLWSGALVFVCGVNGLVIGSLSDRRSRVLQVSQLRAELREACERGTDLALDAIAHPVDDNRTRIANEHYRRLEALVRRAGR